MNSISKNRIYLLASDVLLGYFPSSFAKKTLSILRGPHRRLLRDRCWSVSLSGSALINCSSSRIYIVVLPSNYSSLSAFEAHAPLQPVLQFLKTKSYTLPSLNLNFPDLVSVQKNDARSRTTLGPSNKYLKTTSADG